MPPFALYFAGIGTVVAALGLGFAGAMFLTSTKPVKDDSTFAAKVERHRAEKVEPVPEPAAQVQPPASSESETLSASSNSSPPSTTKWVTEPPAASTSVPAPVVPITAPLTQPSAPAPAASPSTAISDQPPKAVTPEKPAATPSLTKREEMSIGEKKQPERSKPKETIETKRKATTTGTSRIEREDAGDADSDLPDRAEPAAPPPGMQSIGTISGNAH